MEYPFPLKDGSAVMLYLPKQFSRDDAERLIAFIRTLVLDGNEDGEKP